MREVTTDRAPASIGPFSQGIISGDKIYVSGQGPVDPDIGEVIEGGVAVQTERTIENISAVLEAADASLEDLVKATVFVMDMSDYNEINEVYGAYMSEPYPARSAVQVEDLPVDIGVEIEVVAQNKK